MAAYEWKNSRDAHAAGLPAQVVGEEISRIEGRDGVCAPAVLVDESRPEEAPLHPVFEWDDETAGELYRVCQARYLVRQVRVVADSGPPQDQPPAFVSVTRDEKRGYVATATVMADTSMRSQAIKEALGQLRGLRQRYKTLAALSPVWEAVDQAVLEFEKASEPVVRKGDPTLGCTSCEWTGPLFSDLARHTGTVHGRMPTQEERVPLTPDAQRQRQHQDAS